MEEIREGKAECCFGCLTRSDEKPMQFYTVQNEHLKTILQMTKISLCNVCKKVAERTELFIQNVQSNQILLENYDVMDPTFLAVRAQTQPLISLTNVPLDVIELGSEEEQVGEESSSVIYSSSKDMKIKIELKVEEEMPDHLEGEFVDDDCDFQTPYLKEEDFPLNELLKEELQFELKNGTALKKRKNKTKEKRSKISKKEMVNITTVYISKEQCMEERAKMLQDKQYLRSSFKCPDCIKGFIFKGSYEKHMEKHSEKMGDYECDICKQRMSSEEKLLSHMKYHQVRYRCNECGLTRICRLTIKDHYTAFHCYGYYQYRCQHCGKDFKRQVSLRKHIAYTHRNREQVSCAYCNKKYANKDVLKTHLIRMHPKEVAAEKTSKKCICQECGMAFSAPSQLKKHSIKHSDSRNYYCVECDKSFKSDYILKHHLKTASPHVSYTELPLPCLHCDKRFAIRRDLERHTNRVHLNIRPHQCDRCDKAYVNGWSLTEHKRLIHEGYKRPLKFPCSMCDKVFDRKQILKGHMRTHTGERPYQCSKCPAQFSQASSLGTHVKLIHLKLTRDGRPKATLK